MSDLNCERVVVRRLIRVIGASCNPAHGEVHFVKFDHGLIPAYAEIGSCIRCPRSFLFEPDGRVTPIPATTPSVQARPQEKGVVPGSLRNFLR